jgi:putative transposase
MSQSLANVLLHIVFSTKHRQPFLKSEGLRRELEGYIVGILKNQNCPSLAVRCVDDHIHILCSLSRTITIARLLEEIKSSSSAWVKAHACGAKDFYWQNGYGAFSVSQSNVEQVKQYIANQDEHHRKLSFQDEFRLLLRKHAIEWDERYVWD